MYGIRYQLPRISAGCWYLVLFFMFLISKHQKTVLKQVFSVPADQVWPKRNEYDGQRKEADPGAAPDGGGPSPRPSEAAQGPDEKAHSRGCGFGKGSAADNEHEFERVGNISSRTYKLSTQSRSVPVRRGAPLFPARRAHLLTTRKRAVVLPSAVVRSPRRMRPLRGPAGNDCGHSRCVWNRPARRPVPYASENLPLAAFHCLRGTKDEGRKTRGWETKDGGNKNWRFII